jgi:hypothetical protein
MNVDCLYVALRIVNTSTPCETFVRHTEGGCLRWLMLMQCAGRKVTGYGRRPCFNPETCRVNMRLPETTVETEANVDSRSMYKSGPSFLVCSARCAGTKDFSSAVAALVGPVKNIFSPHRTLFHLICTPIAKQAGQAVVPHHQSLNIYLWR